MGDRNKDFDTVSPTNLTRSLVPSVSQAKTINALLSFDTYFMTESDEFRTLYQDPITRVVSISMGYLSCQTLHMDVCMKAGE